MVSVQKTLFVIAGPTAVGKTAASIRLAKHLGCDVVSADSRQLYREMHIGTAAPDKTEQDGVKHHFIASHAITENFDAGRYEKEALAVLEQLMQKQPVQVLCGGSGLYVDAVCNGFDALPQKDETVRAELQTLFENEGVVALQEKLKQLDPDFYAVVDLQNPHRLVRALEVCIVSGKPYSAQRMGQAKERPFRIVKIALEMEREVLYNRINVRVDAMMNAGLEAEVKKLLPYRTHNALQTVGYKELFAYFNNSCTYNEAVDLIKQHTRNFAKRQMTWLRRDGSYHWIEAGDHEALINYAEAQLRN